MVIQWVPLGSCPFVMKVVRNRRQPQMGRQLVASDNWQFVTKAVQKSLLNWLPLRALLITSMSASHLDLMLGLPMSASHLDLMLGLPKDFLPWKVQEIPQNHPRRLLIPMQEHGHQ